MEDAEDEVPNGVNGEEVQEVPIVGDGDCFFSAIVEAFSRNGRDITDLPGFLEEVKICNSLLQSLDDEIKIAAK